MLWQSALSGLPRLRLGGCLGWEFHVSGEDRTSVAPSQFPALHRHLGQGSAWHWRLGSAWNCSERSLEVEAEDYKRFNFGFLMEHLSGKSVPSHCKSMACYLQRIQGIREEKMKFFVNNEVQQLRDQRGSVKTHTRTYTSLNMHMTQKSSERCACMCVLAHS